MRLSLGAVLVIVGVAFAVQATQSRVFAAWRPVRDEHALFERARALLARVGLAHTVGRVANAAVVVVTR